MDSTINNDEKCIFCNIKENDIVMQGFHCIVIYDNFPVSNGHCLIIPKRHIKNAFDLYPWEINEMFDFAKKMKKEIDERYHPDGYNIGFNVNESGGQSIPHVHMHIIPRDKGDVKNPRGGIRGVIPNMQIY